MSFLRVTFVQVSRPGSSLMEERTPPLAGVEPRWGGPSGAGNLLRLLLEKREGGGPGPSAGSVGRGEGGEAGQERGGGDRGEGFRGRLKHPSPPTANTQEAPVKFPGCLLLHDN